jgi:hypothetical protein
VSVFGFLILWLKGLESAVWAEFESALWFFYRILTDHDLILILPSDYGIFLISLMRIRSLSDRGRASEILRQEEVRLVHGTCSTLTFTM